MSTYACTPEWFADDIKTHAMTIAKDDGVYRHLRFRRPGTSCYGFDILTWPGHLCYTGDMGSFLFTRIEDMFEFFRQPDIADPANKINPHYWSEKLIAINRQGGFEEFSKDRFTKRVNEVLDEDEATPELRQAVKDDVIDASESQQDCYRNATDFEWNGESYFRDVWEWDMQDYTFHFIWCCYAIVWGIKQWDAELKARGSRLPF